MPYELRYWEQADEILNALEHDPGRSELYAEVQGTLADLADDPGDPSLHTVPWITPTYGSVHMTPVARAEWYVVWWLWTGENALDEAIEVIYVGPAESRGTS